MRNRRAKLPIALCVLVVAIVGCGGPKRVPLHGKVTLNGQPVPQGFLLFMPTQETQGPVGNATIQAGEYRVEKENGVVPGTYKVSVSIAPEFAVQVQGGPPVASNADRKTIAATLAAKAAQEEEDRRKGRKPKPVEEAPPPPRTQWEFDIEVERHGSHEKNFELQ